MEIWPREGLWHNLGQLFSLILFKLSHWDWKSWSRGPEEQILGGPRDTAGFLRWPWFPPFLMSSLFNFPWVLQNTLHYPLGGLKQLEFIVSQLWWPETYHHGVGRLGSFWWLWGKTLPLCLSQSLVAICNPWHVHVAPFPTARMYTQSLGCHGTLAFPHPPPWESLFPQPPPGACGLRYLLHLREGWSCWAPWSSSRVLSLSPSLCPLLPQALPQVQKTVSRRKKDQWEG